MYNAEITFENMKGETNNSRLKSLIERAVKNAKHKITDLPLYVCGLSEVSQADILNQRKLYIANGKIYYCPGGSEVHESAALHFGAACQAAAENVTGKACNFFPKRFNVINLYQCGVAHIKEPDFTLSISENEVDPPFPIVGEVAFSHESTSQLLYELINSISVYTEPHYAMGLKINYNSASFIMELIVLERTTARDSEKIKMLENCIDSENLITNECLERPFVSRIEDINSEDFGCKVVFHYVVTEYNINNDVIINLNTKCITDADGQMKIVIKAADLKYIKNKWEEHMETLKKE